MPKLTGFELLELLEDPPSTIFLTAFNDFALQAFESNAVDYILKPVTPERFNKAISKWKALAAAGNSPQPPFNALAQALPGTYQQRIVVKHLGAIKIITPPEIHYIEASDDYIKVVCDSGYYLKKQTLSNLETTLDPKQFVRVHRSYIIPIARLAKIEPYEKEGFIALLHGGGKVNVSKAGMAKLKEILAW